MNIPNRDSAILRQIADSMGLQFSLHGHLLSNEEVFATDGALPLFYLAASNIAEEVELEGLDVAIGKDESALFELQAMVGENNHSVRLMLLTDAMFGFVDSELLRENNNERVIDLARLQTRLSNENAITAKMEF